MCETEVEGGREEGEGEKRGRTRQAGHSVESLGRLRLEADMMCPLGHSIQLLSLSFSFVPGQSFWTTKEWRTSVGEINCPIILCPPNHACAQRR